MLEGLARVKASLRSLDATDARHAAEHAAEAVLELLHSKNRNECGGMPLH